MLAGGQEKIILYTQLADVAGEIWDAIICDEAHYLKLEYAKFIAGINPNWIVLVTATPPREEDKAQIFRFLVGSNKVSMPLSEAIDRSDINDYRLRIFTYDIQGQEWAEYFDICKSLNWAQMKGYKGAQEKFINKRLHYIYSLPSKLANTQELVRRARNLDLRRLIFMGRKDMADAVSPYRLHSGVSREAYEAFLRGEIDECATVNQIQEGANIPNLPLIIIGQTNGTSYGLLQRIGRTLRLDPEETSQIWLLCAQNTQDLTWVHKGIKGIDPKKISWEPFH
jgi:superfamily II DNA or RNA helicase